MADRVPFRPPWLDPPPTQLVADPVAAWAVRQDELILDRVHALVEAVAVDPPAWAGAIMPRPEPGWERDRWDRDVALVVAYRDQHALPDDVAHRVTVPRRMPRPTPDPLSPEPGRGCSHRPR